MVIPPFHPQKVGHRVVRMVDDDVHFFPAAAGAFEASCDRSVVFHRIWLNTPGQGFQTACLLLWYHSDR